MKFKWYKIKRRFRERVSPFISKVSRWLDTKAVARIKGKRLPTGDYLFAYRRQYLKYALEYYREFRDTDVEYTARTMYFWNKLAEESKNIVETTPSGKGIGHNTMPLNICTQTRWAMERILKSHILGK